MWGLLPGTQVFDFCLKLQVAKCCCSVQILQLLKMMAFAAIVGLKAEGLGLLFFHQKCLSLAAASVEVGRG